MEWVQIGVDVVLAVAFIWYAFWVKGRFDFLKNNMETADKASSLAGNLIDAASRLEEQRKLHLASEKETSERELEDMKRQLEEAEAEGYESTAKMFKVIQNQISYIEQLKIEKRLYHDFGYYATIPMKNTDILALLQFLRRGAEDGNPYDTALIDSFEAEIKALGKRIIEHQLTKAGIQPKSEIKSRNE